jgi:Na+:H+ antiporter, NhaA family
LRIGDFSISEDLRHWVNDGLMAIFFFVVGLEIKRELVVGELTETRRAALPVVAALAAWSFPRSSTSRSARARAAGASRWRPTSPLHSAS